MILLFAVVWRLFVAHEYILLLLYWTAADKAGGHLEGELWLRGGVPSCPQHSSLTDQMGAGRRDGG